MPKSDQPGRIEILFTQWGSPDAQRALDVRMAVFVLEQRVPAEIEVDDVDLIAWHAVAVDETGAACGTGRLYPDSVHPDCAHIGRMAVLASHRGRGVGSALMEALLAEASRREFRKAELSAQTHAIPFYERHGFVATGPVYDDAGIPHRKMTRVFG